MQRAGRPRRRRRDTIIRENGPPDRVWLGGAGGDGRSSPLAEVGVISLTADLIIVLSTVDFAIPDDKPWSARRAD